MEIGKKNGADPFKLTVISAVIGILIQYISDIAAINISFMGEGGLRSGAAVLTGYMAGVTVMAAAMIYGGTRAAAYGIKLLGIYKLRDSEDIELSGAAAFAVRYFGKHLPALTIIFGIILLGFGATSFAAGNFSGGPLDIHMSEISGNSEKYKGGNISLLCSMALDAAEGETVSYKVNEGYSIDFGGQYLAFFGYEDSEIWASEMLAAQIGRRDRIRITENLPGHLSAEVKIYKRSGLIESIECEKDLSGFEGHTWLYNIYPKGDCITYSFEGSGTEPDNLCWCGFKEGESLTAGYKNALFAFNAEGKDLEIGTAKVLCREVCLYAWTGGGYEPVSNTVDIRECAAVNEED